MKRLERSTPETSREGRRFEDYWAVVWHRKWVIGLTVAAAVAAVVVGNRLAPRIFEATSTLEIKEQVPSVLGGATAFSDLSPLEELNTQMEILKSRSLLEEVIAEVGLTEALVTEKGLPPGERLQLTVDALRKQLSVSSVTNTRLIRVSARSRDPVLAMTIANSICRAFIDRNVESKRSAANAVLAFVSDQVNQVSERLDNAEEELLRYKQIHRIADISEEARLKLDRLSDLQVSYEQVRLDRQILATRISSTLAVSSPDASAAAPVSPAVAALQDRLTAVERRLAETQAGDPGEASLQASAESLKRDIQAEMGRTVAPGRSTSVNSVVQAQVADYRYQDVVLAAQEEAYRGLIDANEAEVNTLSAQDISLARLERTRRINDDLYSQLVKSKNDAQIEAVSQLGNIDVIDPAVTPLRPVSPRTEENLVVGLLLSVVLGICFAFLLDHFDTTIKSEEEVRKLLQIPLLGFIPRFHQNGSSAPVKPNGGLVRRSHLFTRDEPGSSVSEAFRLLRTNLFFIELDKGLKTIAVTSAIPGEGKTVVAVNLAAALAAQEEKVLIVDADFRAPAVHKALLLPQAPGFTNVLVDRLSFRDLLREVDGMPNLRAITAGRTPPNPAEITGSARMREMIEELRGSFDRIIFDGPPILGASDAVVLASHVDGALVVLRKGKIDRKAIGRITEILGHTRVTVLGAVLNGVDRQDAGYGYGYYYPRK